MNVKKAFDKIDAAEQKSPKPSLSSPKFMPMLKPSCTPTDIMDLLDDNIIGQKQAKKQLAVAVYNHQKRLEDRTGIIRKSNILMIGSTGSGKTLFAQTLANALNVPFVIVDATTYTQTGYIGDDVESIISRLLTAANRDISRAQKGIVYIDEIDKISRKGLKSGITRDATGEGVRQALLKLIEGCEVNLLPPNERKQQGAKFIPFDTSNVLFICGGAFEGLLEKKSAHRQIGFTSLSGKNHMESNSVTVEDLEKYGLIPELLGRLPVIVQLEALTEDDLIDILTKPKNSIIKEYVELLKRDDIALTFTPNALHHIAKQAIEQKNRSQGVAGNHRKYHAGYYV